MPVLSFEILMTLISLEDMEFLAAHLNIFVSSLKLLLLTETGNTIMNISKISSWHYSFLDNT